MLRVLLAFLIVAIATVTLALLGAGEWPRLLFFAAMIPFVAIAAHYFEPELEKWAHRRRAARQ